MPVETRAERIARLRRELDRSPTWDKPGADPLGDLRRFAELSRLIWEF